MLVTFLLVVSGAFVLSIGARAQLLTGQLSDGHLRQIEGKVERPTLLLPVLIFCAATSAAVMAWLGQHLAALMPAEASRLAIAAAAALGALELAWPVRTRPMQEPTRSLVAIAAVMAVRQISSASGLLIFAAAACGWEFETVWIGGALGLALAGGLGWRLGAARLARWPLTAVRIACALPLIVASILIVMNNHFAIS